MTRTFVFDEKTIWLLRKATAEATRGNWSKADRERLIELSEHVFLRAAIQEPPPATPFSFDHKAKRALP